MMILDVVHAFKVVLIIALTLVIKHVLTLGH